MMNNMQDISVIILTKNEELHIKRCIENAQRFAKEIFVVDSYSTDNTVEIAEQLGAKVFQNPWSNYARQFSWALDHLPISTEWIWRMDADEYLGDELIEEIKTELASPAIGVNGYTASCFRIFMGKEIRNGIIPLILLRLLKHKYVCIENRWMDEHLYITEGKIGKLKYHFYDDNLNSLTWWTNKHNHYATREAIDLLMTEYRLLETNQIVNMGEHSASIRKKKLNYLRLPLFLRAFLFFIYRYIFRLGFLEGKEGFLWHFLQGFWYRVLADAKVYEIKKRFKFDDAAIKEWLIKEYRS